MFEKQALEAAEAAQNMTDNLEAVVKMANECGADCDIDDALSAIRSELGHAIHELIMDHAAAVRDEIADHNHYYRSV